MPIIVDGYNLLRAVQKMEEFASFTDVQLCRALSDYLRCSRERGHIVFDGIGPPDKSAFGGIPALEVYFSGETLDADTVIEQKIADSTAPKGLIVVSSDRRIRTSATKRRAVSVGADAFWQILVTRLEKESRRPAPEPVQKRRGLTDRETQIWLKKFDMLD